MDTCISENSQKKVRIKAFDILKLYAIFLVLWGHSIASLLPSNCYDNPLFRIIYSFHMPLFMMISGYFSTSSMSLSPFSFFKKKFIQLILPVISWSIVFGIIFFFDHFTDFNIIKLTIGEILYNIYNPGPIWFLKTCFFCHLLIYIGNLLNIDKNIWIIISLIISQSILTPFISRVTIMYPCFIIGMELNNNQKFYSYTFRYYFWFIGLFVFMLCFWDQFFWGCDGILKTIIINYIHINSSLFLLIFSRLYRLIIGIVGSLSFIGLICSLFPQEKTNRFISICSHWGQYTLGIYILQTLILETFMARCIVLEDLDPCLVDFIVTPIISLFVLVLCVYIIKTMSKSHLLAFLFFGYYKTNNI